MDTGRKVTIQDLIGDSDCSDDKSTNQQKKIYAIMNNQKKYSHTKKVKPWRVGGHQQQITPKGFKKGFRK